MLDCSIKPYHFFPRHEHITFHWNSRGKHLIQLSIALRLPVSWPSKWFPRTGHVSRICHFINMHLRPSKTFRPTVLNVVKPAKQIWMSLACGSNCSASEKFLSIVLVQHLQDGELSGLNSRSSQLSKFTLSQSLFINSCSPQVSKYTSS